MQCALMNSVLIEALDNDLTKGCLVWYEAEGCASSKVEPVGQAHASELSEKVCSSAVDY